MFSILVYKREDVAYTPVARQCHVHASNLERIIYHKNVAIALAFHIFMVMGPGPWKISDAIGEIHQEAKNTTGLGI